MPKYYLKSYGNRKIVLKIFGVFIIFSGISLILYFFFPIISYQIFIADALETNKIETPLPRRFVLSGSASIKDLFSTTIKSIAVDYKDARSWYPQVKSTVDESHTSVDSYNISIPKLKINNATVSTVDYDLSSHLVQYFGTALPGQVGTAVVFGHSTLPQLFNEKNYKTIFATLHNLKIGDEINLNVSNKEYKYKVFAISVTSPEDVNMFSQSYDHSYLTLVTCTPPGTVWKRLVVRATLET